MMSRNDEPMEGVVFDVQDHARWTGTRGSVHMGRWLVWTSMGLKSPSDGCWDGRGRKTLWRSLTQRRRRTPSSGHLAETIAHGDQPLTDGTLTLMIRTPPRVAWTISGACGSVLGFFGTCGRLQEPQEGQRLAQWMMIMPQQGQRLPFRGQTSPLLAYFWHFSM